MQRVLSVLVYAVRGDEVLLMRRNKEPNLGLWIAPGGKMEQHESPVDTAVREMHEETGLLVEDLAWRGLCTEVSPRPDWQWLLFIFVARRFSGTLRADLREGMLAWVPVARYLTELPIPQADAIFAPRILLAEAGMFHAKFIYDDALRLVDWIAY